MTIFKTCMLCKKPFEIDVGNPGQWAGPHCAGGRAICMRCVKGRRLTIQDPDDPFISWPDGDEFTLFDYTKSKAGAIGYAWYNPESIGYSYQMPW